MEIATAALGIIIILAVISYRIGDIRDHLGAIRKALEKIAARERD